MKFSVLLSFYLNDNHVHLNESIKSVFTNQILKPNQVVIVCDGPISKSQNDVLHSWKTSYPDFFDIVKIPINVGLVSALNHGLRFCKYDYVARMDSDDISTNCRFLKQISFLESNPGISLVGSNILEFKNNISNIIYSKNVPSNPVILNNYIKFRNPFNHMSVIFNKKDVLDNGGYPLIDGYEDYLLWVILHKNGYKLANLNDNLVFARIDNGFLFRRNGIKLFKNEIKLQYKFYTLKLFNFNVFIFNVFFRSLVRLFPSKFLNLIYKLLRNG